MADSRTKLKTLLRELFQLDSADLDFGIYRIMNSKRSEIERFLDNDLLPQIKEAFSQYKSSDSVQLKTDLDKLVQQLKDAGVDPELSPKVKELREKLSTAVDLSALENQVFSDLFNFFRRYYNEGDFLSLRRYKEGVYAIPYEGEEVKFYWANHDQYYIKTSEYLRDYAFRLADGRRVHFRLAAADTEKDNNKAANGNGRRFILVQGDTIAEENGELVIRFEFRPDPEKRRQDALNAQATKAVFEAPATAAWLFALAALDPSETDPNRTVLAKHLKDYTARNTFDYFIHKDVGPFLRRELDFFIKNEVMHLDDIENGSVPRVEEYLSKIKVLRTIAHKVIDFISQIENFQKKLWLKKKFVVESYYCITLDHVPQELYSEIAANEAQIREWVHLFAIDEIQGDLVNPKYSTPLTTEFLVAHQNLIVDTRFFDPGFKYRLLASIGDLDATIDGLLVHSDNFQALHLLAAYLKRRVKCVYIDPPYNTASSSIPYKNDYKHSSFAAMMFDRIEQLHRTLTGDGAIFVSIDKTERSVVQYILDEVFGVGNRVEELIWAMNTNNSQAPNYSTNHEYVLVYAKDRKTAEQDTGMFREPKPGYEEVMELVTRLNTEVPPIAKIEEDLRRLYEQHKIAFREEIDAQGLEWDDEKGNDSWKGLYSYSRAEYRDSAGRLIPEQEAKSLQAQIWIWQEGDASMPATKQATSTHDPDHKNFRFYRPLHPITGEQCPHPKSGWKFAYNDDDDSPDRRSFVSLDRDGRIAWGSDEHKVPRLKRMLHEVETNVGKSVFTDYSDGEKQTSAMFGQSGVFLAPKHADFVSRFILHSAKADSIVVDCFGGSGSTAHAVIKLNRSDRGRRKFVLVEVGDHFDTVLRPRVLKAAYSSDWRAGKPLSRSGISQCIKVLRLESYEDTLNNLELKRNEVQQNLLAQHSALYEDFTLRYMLDVESNGSQSLLNVAAFGDPFKYTLNIATHTVGETERTNVDLIETFNYLLGLRVKHIDTIRGFRVVHGINPAGEKVLVIWRNVDDNPNPQLDDFFQKQGYNTKDMEFDLIYVNGDNNLENLKKDEDRWKVRLIEEEFARLMFDVQDV
jgi:adenine-specific DNA-methyltransferase